MAARHACLAGCENVFVKLGALGSKRAGFGCTSGPTPVVRSTRCGLASIYRNLHCRLWARALHV